MSVPDHLIEKAARARAEKLGLGWDATHPESRRAYAVQSRVAIEAVAGELRAESARAQRERIARAVETATWELLPNSPLTREALAALVRGMNDQENTETRDA